MADANVFEVPQSKLTTGQDQVLLDRRQQAGAWLRSIREATKLSTQDLALRIGSAREFVTGIERGDDRLPTTLWLAYAQGLGVGRTREFGKQLLQLYDATLFTLLFGDPSSLTNDDWTRRTGTRKASSDAIARARKAAGIWLREQREGADLTQQQLVDTIGIGKREFVSLIESGRSRLPRERYPAYAKALNCDLQAFAMQMTIFNDPELFDILFNER